MPEETSDKKPPMEEIVTTLLLTYPNPRKSDDMHGRLVAADYLVKQGMLLRNEGVYEQTSSGRSFTEDLLKYASERLFPPLIIEP